MSDAVFIDDGLERPFLIPGIAGMHGEISGSRRMMASKEVVAYRRRCKELQERQQSPAAETLRDKLLAKQIVSWCFDREVNEANVAKLHPVILSKLEAIVMGVIPDGTENLDSGAPKSDAEVIAELSGN